MAGNIVNGITGALGVNTPSLSGVTTTVVGKYGDSASYNGGLETTLGFINSKVGTNVLKINENKPQALPTFLTNALNALDPKSGADADLLKAMNAFAKSKNLPELTDIKEMTGKHLAGLVIELQRRNKLDHDLLAQPGKGGLIYDLVEVIDSVDPGNTMGAWSLALNRLKAGAGTRPGAGAPAAVSGQPTTPSSIDPKLDQILDKLKAAAEAGVQLGKPSDLLKFIQTGLNFINGSKLAMDGQPSAALLAAINKNATDKGGPTISSLNELTPMHLREIIKDLREKQAFSPQNPQIKLIMEGLGKALHEINDPEIKKLANELAPQKPRWGAEAPNADPIIVAGGYKSAADEYDPLPKIAKGAEQIVVAEAGGAEIQRTLTSRPVIAPKV